MIPKIAHFYWGGEPLPYINYLTLSSFKRHNPTWRMRLYTPSKPTKAPMRFNNWISYNGKNYIDEAIRLCDHVSIDPDTVISDHVHDVHRSDILRWNLLSSVGGLWSDMDILYTSPVERHLNLDKDTFICKERVTYKNNVLTNSIDVYFIGFLLSSVGNRFYGLIRDKAVDRIIESYQSVGSDVFKLIPDRKFVGVENINPMLLYSVYPSSSILDNFYKKQGKINEVNTKDKIGIHWYNGHNISRRNLYPVTPQDTHLDPNTFIHSLVQDIINFDKDKHGNR